jgi:hypothetical protein
MKYALMLPLLALLLFAAGCTTTPKNLGHEGGKPYADIPVPSNYAAYDTPPFKRQDSDAGKRIYGRYAYKSTDGLDSAAELATWFSRNLPAEGWQLQTEDVDDAKGTMTLRYIKGEGDDAETLKLALSPDKRVQGSDRFSILIVELNPQYD